LPYQVIRRHNLVEIKRIKELALTALPPSQHAPPRKCPSQPNGITARDSSQPEFCNTISLKADIIRTSFRLLMSRPNSENSLVTSSTVGRVR
jgi:hypothetical protein